MSKFQRRHYQAIADSLNADLFMILIRPERYYKIQRGVFVDVVKSMIVLFGTDNHNFSAHRFKKQVCRNLVKTSFLD